MNVVSFAVAMLLAGPLGQYTDEVDASNAGVRFRLLEGSTFADLYDLSPGDPLWPIRGSFNLRRVAVDAPWPTYLLSYIRFDTLPSVPQYSIRGNGWYRLYDEDPSGLHELNLNVAVNGNAPLIFMTSNVVPWEAPFPTIEIDVVETYGGDDHLYAMHLIAEPLRPVNFSTEWEFHSGVLPGYPEISPGDLLSTRGVITRTNAELTALLGIMPVAPDIGLDALTRTPATSSILFSAEIDAFSEFLGLLQHGDLLNEYGFIGFTNQQLTTAFEPMPVVEDAGLDAAHVALFNGEIWFSLEEPLFSEALGITLEPGDLLSVAGYVVKTNQQLLENFQIEDPSLEGYGLDAAYRLPNGTVLFSTEDGFIDTRFGAVGDGDLLSDNGHVIQRNLDLVSALAPIEDLDNFGLDALEVSPLIYLADANQDGAISLTDYVELQPCLTDPAGEVPAGCEWADVDGDGDADLVDYLLFTLDFTGAE